MERQHAALTPEPTIATGLGAERLATPTDTVEARTDAQNEILDRAKQLGRTTLKTGSKIIHTFEDKFHELRDREVPDETSRRAKMIAGASVGTVLVASTVRRIKSHSAREKVRLSAPQKLVAKSKELISH